MKKIVSLLVVVILGVVMFISLTACAKENYVAFKIEGAEDEQYGFAVAKNETKKNDFLSACNKVIESLIDSGDMEKLVNYHNLKSSDEEAGENISIPDVSGNTNTLYVYTEVGFAPYEYYSNEKITGVDIDIMTLVASELKMKVEFTDVDFETIITNVKTLESNKLKVAAAGLTMTDERKIEVDFSNPYVSSIQYIVSSEKNSFKNLEDLKGKKIGVQNGTTGDIMVGNAIKDGVLKGTNAENLGFKNAPLAFMDLKSNKINAIVIDELTAKNLLKKK